ncbi:MAG: hypothetical protein AAGL10_07370 [Pseudomonadota bacterium]
MKIASRLAALFVLVSASLAAAQSGLKPGSLKVEGLNYESEVSAIYQGDFANARLQPEGDAYSFLLRNYIDAFSRKCAAQLPANKVEIMAQRCTAERVTRNGFGVEISRTCAQWETYGTGRYADPALMSISKRLEAKQGRDAITSIVPNRGGDPAAYSRRITDIALAAQGDMDTLLGQNACSSAALKRFQANMQRFGSGSPALKLAGGATLASTRGGGGAYVPSDYGKMVDALIDENARGWMMNRYMKGSVTAVSVTQKDAAGRPTNISARYRFNQLGQIQNGSVQVAFKDGRPVCMYFFDARSTCRVPNPGVVTAYEKGEYR